MDTATTYARALEAAAQTGGSAAAYAKNLHALLVRRGHTKLLPRILSAYEKVLLGRERSAKYKEVSPEKERTRVLLELYKNLTRVSTQKHHG